MDQDIIKSSSPEPENKQDPLAECQQKCGEYLNNWKRAAADFANYKKDEMERLTTLLQYGREGMIGKFLPVVDSLYYATKHIKDAGLEQVWQHVVEFLKKEGVEEIEVVGKKFDPEIMEAVGEVEPASTDPRYAEGSGEARGSGVVKEELQKGYMMDSKVLRPAKVKVYK